jgi:AcrR family transcriptional regulator
MPGQDPGSSGPGGRPRNEHIDAAVIAATLAMLDEDGYGGVSLEAVARRAGTSRPAIYRRWPGRPSLLLAAIADRLDLPTPPDTGCTLCDIGESFDVVLNAYRSFRPETLSALYAECANDPDLRARYRATVIEPTRAAISRTIDRAIARGDLRSHIDRKLLVDIVSSLVQDRAMFGPQHLDDAEAEHAIEILLRGAAADYPALLAHSEAMEREHRDASGAHHIQLSQP